MMKKMRLLFAALLFNGLVTISVSAIEQSAADSDLVTPLQNRDVLLMVEKKVDTETIIKAIQSSPCTFDTFPSVLRELKRRGVPQAVLQSMIDAPYGPAARVRLDERGEQPIYHYAEQLKPFMVLTPSAPSRATRRNNRSERARSARTTRRRN